MTLRGRLQAAKRNRGRVSDPTAAMSGSHPKAPGFAGGYLLLFGRLLEARAKGRTSEAIRALARLQPKTARILRGGETM